MTLCIRITAVFLFKWNIVQLSALKPRRKLKNFDNVLQLALKAKCLLYLPPAVTSEVLRFATEWMFVFLMVFPVNNNYLHIRVLSIFPSCYRRCLYSAVQNGSTFIIGANVNLLIVEGTCLLLGIIVIKPFSYSRKKTAPRCWRKDRLSGKPDV